MTTMKRARAGVVAAVWGVAMAGLCTGGVCRADDGYLEGESGAVHLMKGHPSIRMVSEEVRIKLPEGRVEASFVFKNEGPATDVAIGFPETGKDIDRQIGKGIDRSRHWTHLQGFRSTIDGQPIHVTRQVARKPTDENDYDYSYFWVKKVHFAHGQTRRIVDHYAGGWEVTTFGMAGFRYVLKSGASWHGTIGHARILCDLGSVGNYGPIQCKPAGFRRTGHTIVWDIDNLKPTEDISLWWYEGFADLSVNGKGLFKADGGSMEQDVDLWGYYSASGPRPYRKGEEVWVPLRIVYLWLGADLNGQWEKRNVTVTRGTHTAPITVGTALSTPDASPSFATEKVLQKDGAVYVPLRPLVAALGGTANYDSAGRLNIAFSEPGRPDKKSASTTTKQ